MDVRGNWDAMGMRGSGSHDVVFTDCFVPEPMMLLGNPLGEFGTQGWLGIATLNFALIGAFLGIAEAAREQIIATVSTRKKPPFEEVLAARPATQYQIAEIDVALTAARAALGHTGEMLDEQAERPDSELTVDDVKRLMHQWQCTKLIVNRAAADVVDRAVALSGGAGYLANNDLSRMYRDVRAGPFMQPLSPNEAFEYIGRVALGLEPDAEIRDLIERLKQGG